MAVCIRRLMTHCSADQEATAATTPWHRLARDTILSARAVHLATTAGAHVSPEEAVSVV